MDFEAVYAVPGGANPALLLDNPDFNRKSLPMFAFVYREIYSDPTILHLKLIFLPLWEQ